MSVSKRSGAMLAASLLVALAGCSGAATAPSPRPFTAMGTWSGSFEYTTAGVRVREDATVVFTQPTAGVARGDWTSVGLVSGRMDFAVAAAVEGTLTILQQAVGSGTCRATGTLTGTASATELVLTIQPLTPDSGCVWATNMRFSLTREM